MSMIKRAWKRVYTVVMMPDYVMGVGPFPAGRVARLAVVEPVQQSYGKGAPRPSN